MSSTEKHGTYKDQTTKIEAKTSSMVMPSIPMPDTKPEIKFNKVGPWFF